MVIRKAFGAVGNDLVFKLKNALLQEVASVAINLYSGRFKIDVEDLQLTKTAIKDSDRMAKPLDPLRVCVVGQVSVGKSSVINALKQEMVAEIDSLPSTDKTTVYQCSTIDGIELLHLLDLKGLDGTPTTEDGLLHEITGANVILWVLKANQPARSLDSAFKARLDDWYDKPENISRKRPVIIGVLNQVDQLKPVHQWNPPYSLDDESSAKVAIINEALTYNQEMLHFDSIIPLSVSDQRQHYNLRELETLLFKNLEIGLDVQLNKRRLEGGDDITLKDQLTRQARLIKQSFKLALRIS